MLGIVLQLYLGLFPLLLLPLLREWFYNAITSLLFSLTYVTSFSFSYIHYLSTFNKKHISKTITFPLCLLGLIIVICLYYPSFTPLLGSFQHISAYFLHFLLFILHLFFFLIFPSFLFHIPFQFNPSHI